MSLFIFLILSIITNSQWISPSAPLLPTARSWMAAGSYNQSIFLLGDREIITYNIDQNTFTSTNISEDETLQSGSAQYYTSVNRILYIAQKSYLSIYNMATNEFTEQCQLYPNSIFYDYFYYPCITSSDEYLYIIGGSIYYKLYSADVYSFSLSTNQWITNLPSLNIARKSHSCIAHESSEKIYVIAGYNSPLGYLSSIECIGTQYIESNQWQIIGNMSNNGLSGTRAVSFYDTIYIIAGFYSHYSYRYEERIVHIINTSNDEISTLSDNLVYGLWPSPAVIMVENVMYVFGGSAETAPYDNTVTPLDTWMYYTLPNMSEPLTTYLPSTSSKNTYNRCPSGHPSESPSGHPSESPSGHPSEFTELPYSPSNSMDLHECYPPAKYAPYWIIVVGFITSTIIQIFTFASGNSIIGFIKYALCCKCFRNVKYDDSEQDEWTEFPEVIDIAFRNPFIRLEKIARQSSRYFGKYNIQYDRWGKAFYESNFVSTADDKPYVFKYSDRYNGCWILFAQDEECFGYEMIQNNVQENEEKTVEMTSPENNSNDDDYKLLIDDIVELEVKNDVTPLQLLNRKWQNFKVTPAERIDIDVDSSIDYASEFLDDQRTNLPPLLQSQIQFNGHSITFSGLKVYKNKVSNGIVLNINGTYRSTSVRSHDGYMGRMEFKFTHSLDAKLHATYYISLNNASLDTFVHKCFIRIKHDELGKLASYDMIADGYVLYSRENMQIIYDTMKCEQCIFKYGEEVQVTLKIEKSATWKGCIDWLMISILFAVVIYQFIVDCISFVHYAASSTNRWYTYECYAYIITNSANMKQFFIFGLCWGLLGDSFAYRKFASTGHAFDAVSWFFRGLFLPVFVTHIAPWQLVYCWVWLGIAFCGFCYYAKIRYFDSKEKRNENWVSKGELPCKNWILIAFWGVCIGITCYFFIILFPVSSMSRLYDGNKYWYSFYSVFTDRNTSEYVDLYSDRWLRIQQIIVWIF